jgi:hypothetical protein
MTVAGTIVLLNVVAALAALTAALLWHRSATIQVLYRDDPDADGIHSAAIIINDKVDFISTAVAQSTWSKRGAYAAAVAAAFQAAALLVQSIST